MGRSPRRAVAIALLALAVTAAGCTVGPSQRPPVAVRGENLPAAPSATATGPTPEELPEPEAGLVAIPFVDCTQDALLVAPPVPPDRALQVECGEIIVPADPDHPGLGGVSLGVKRVSLTSASPDDLPPLLALGDAGVDPSAAHALTLAAQVSPAVLDGFAIIGLDRRGSGTDLLDCAPYGARAALVDATVTSEDALSDLLEDARDVVQECNLTLDGGLGSFRTALAASDVEQLRAGLGVRTLSAIGVGDGAAALAAWARSAPTSVGRLVLDGPPHPDLDDPDLSESRAGAAEAAFEAFAVSCRAAAGCPLGTDPRAAVTTLVDRLRVQPLAAVDGSRLTAGAALTVLLDGLGDPPRWPALAAALAAATNGDPAPLLAALLPLTGPGGRFDGALATTCNDTRRRLSPGEIAELTASWRGAYPLFGTALAMRLVACAPWPTSPDAGSAPGRAEGAPPILVLGTAADPQGALEGSRRTAESLLPARFLSWQGAGTGAYPRTPCVTGFVESMLVAGVVPPSGILCPP